MNVEHISKYVILVISLKRAWLVYIHELQNLCISAVTICMYTCDEFMFHLYSEKLPTEKVLRHESNYC